MASRLSREIEGVKNRLSPIQQKSKIPVRRVTRLHNNSETSSSSKDEVNMKQHILKDCAEKLQNKPPSRIPIAIGRTSSKNVNRDKIPKSVIAATGKRPLGRDSGINFRETCGKQAGSINNATGKRPTATKHGSSEDATESTLPVTRRTPMKQVSPLETEQVSNDEKDPRLENTKTQGDSVQPVNLVSACKVSREEREDKVESDHNPCGIIGPKKVSVSGDYAYLREEVELLKGSLDLSNHREQLLRRQVEVLEKQVSLCKNCEHAFKTEVKTLLESSNGISTSCEEEHKKELEQLEKEHSEIVEELQQWVEDGDKKNKDLEEIIEKTNEENVELLVQISVMKKELKALEKESNTLQTKLQTKRVNVKNILESSNGVSTSYEEDHKKELKQLEREHSEIGEELQQWVEDGDKKNKDLEEIIENTNEENVELLVQISLMKKELKALEKENNTLQTELKTKRTDLKSLRANEHYKERELRNLKHDLKRKEQSLEDVEGRLDNAQAEKQELLDDIDYLKGSLGDSQAGNKQLNAQTDELKVMVKELNKRPDYGHLREEVEQLKGSLDLCTHREEQLKFHVDALEAEASHFKACELDLKDLRDETSSLIEQLEVQLDMFINENARIVSEKDKEFDELKDENARLIDHLNAQLATLRNENTRIISEKDQELNDKKSKVIDQLEDQLARSENRNARIVSEKNKEMNELKKQNSRAAIQLRDQLATLMKENTRIISENVEMMNELTENSRVIDQLEDQLAKLMNENSRITSDKNKQMMELNEKKSRTIDRLEGELAMLEGENSILVTKLSNISYKDKRLTELQEQVESLKEQQNLTLSELDMAYHSLNYTDVKTEKLTKELEREIFEKDALNMALEFSLDNCAIKEKAHARETRNLKNQLEEMRFLLNITDSCSDANGSKNQVCVCREKFFAM